MLCRVLVVCLCFNTLSGTVYASETDNSSQLEYSNTSNVKVLKDGIYINGTYYTKEQFNKLLEKAIPIEAESDLDKITETDDILPTSLPLVAGVYLVPGVGEVVITATGVILVAGAVVVAGSWAYNTIIRYFKEHTKNKRKGNEEKHENANARRKRDQGGEKKKQKGNWKSRGGKR